MNHTEEEVLQVFEGARPVIDSLGIKYKRQDLAGYIDRGHLEPWVLPLWDRWIEKCYQGGEAYTSLLSQPEPKTKPEKKRERKKEYQLELFL